MLAISTGGTIKATRWFVDILVRGIWRVGLLTPPHAHEEGEDGRRLHQVRVAGRSQRDLMRRHADSY
jgi:hypothetical protein